MEKNTVDLKNDIIKWIENKKGFDIAGFDVKEKVSYTDYIIVCTAQSNVHAKAIFEHVMENAENEHIFVQGKEGMKNSNWILVDFSDIILHIFTQESKDYYNIEKMWQ